MMSLNRYRLRHLARKNNTQAQRVVSLLARTDRVLGVVLIGNTFANIAASAVATVIAVKYFKDVGVLIATVILTLVVLIFAEAAPKTLAALYPEKVAFPASRLLEFCLKILYPLVWLVNVISNNVLRLFRFSVTHRVIEPLSIEELRTIVNEAQGKISPQYQQMLLRILDLEQVVVDEIMVPRNEIYGIDVNATWDIILRQITCSTHAHVPLYRDNIDAVIGMLNLRKVLIALQQHEFTREEMLTLADEVYFIPEEALVNRQLVNFQERKMSVGLVVDEYGSVVGLLTLQDVLEEIVGEFSVGGEQNTRLLKLEVDGSYLVDGSVELRDLNRMAEWHLPTDGPRTLSGLLIEYLEFIPKSSVCACIEGYAMEVIRVDHNRIKLVRIWPAVAHSTPGSHEGDMPVKPGL